MNSVSVDVGARAYEIRIGRDWGFGEKVRGIAPCRALVISDTNVDALYGRELESSLKELGFDACRYVLEAGEASKNMRQLEGIYEAALDAGLDRGSVIFALGGGMVGDVAGFAAATYMRGIRYVQVPTSLLAMVDSSVGGKTAVNLERGKNLVGAFHQPVEVDAALDVLATLPDREFSAGLAEVIKYGIIWDAEFLGILERDMDGIMRKDAETLTRVISRCCEIKAEVVAVDERESGVRGILNFGHTLGHSIENKCGYGECLHGEAVSVGTVYAMRLSVLQKNLDPACEKRVKDLLVAAGLPVSVKDLKAELSWESLRALMTADKKTVGGVPRFVLAEGIGSVVFGCEVPEETLRAAYEALLEETQ